MAVRGDTIYKTEIKKLLNKIVENEKSFVSNEDLQSMAEQWDFVLENNTVISKNVICLTSQQ